MVVRQGRRLIGQASAPAHGALATSAEGGARTRLRMTSEDARLDLAGADEFSVVCESLPRTDPYAARKSRLQ